MSDWNWNPVPFDQCDNGHPEPAGPNMDMGQCPSCWSLVGEKIRGYLGPDWTPTTKGNDNG